MKNLKKIPKFKDEAEEAEFWAKHDSTEYIDYKKAKRTLFPNLKPSLHTIAVAIIFILLSLIGCSEHKSDDPNESYRLWSGEAPSSEVKIIHGKYWQSAHWSKEYILYLELKASPKWLDEFIKQNGLVQADGEWIGSQDTPYWFIPPKNYRVWKASDSDQGSRVFEDAVTGHMFIYEIQL